MTLQLKRHQACALALGCVAAAMASSGSLEDPFSLASGSLAAAPAAPVVKDAELYLAFTLLGSVTFVMVLFYLLHWHDDDIRGYSWNVISMSICTFIGVLIGMSWNTCFNAFVVGPPATAGVWNTIGCDVWACLGWYVVLQVVLAVVSGARDKGKKKTELDRVTILLNLKCFAVLFGVTTGASNLALWGFVQSKVPHDHYHLLAVVAACVASCWTLFKIGAAVRYFINSDDGVVDDFENLWERFTEETEDGALAMSTSHLIVQVVRFSITGVLPLPTGAIPPGFHATTYDAKVLFGCGLICAVLIPIWDLCLPITNKTVLRYKGWLKKITSNCGAFCWLYSFTWGIQAVANKPGPPGALLVALFVTIFGFSLIFGLDAIADLPCTGETADREITAQVAPVSILIGFSWKQAFAASITAINSREAVFAPPIQTLCMAIVLAIVVVPAWRIHILPVVMAADVQKQQRRQDELAQKRRGSIGSSRRSSTSSKRDSKVAPLLPAQPAQPESPPPVSVVPPLSAEEARCLPREDLAVRAIQLSTRNLDLEASIRQIQQELGELKQVLMLVEKF
eukprot:CAMPEP_0206545178 /NCGR_PEP_ID=MMETSP0325_2-20121206/11979_1 /ASSEMBLY_ACC=CAM_ASM_000347 /TAXON_ID=2866 /ORGANISM="Crypthecodinium cohnii, Strain Seligo" /LENGTH=567 /DNA_ID=CAMNT_0054044109 /DNA_START=69 /DNA_END=1772 /DNA_ORIENTATION=-